MRNALLVGIVLALAATAWSQVSVEEAQRRLAERAAKRGSVEIAAPATRPATQPAKTPEQLHAEAYEHLTAQRLEKAGPLLDQLRRATLARERSREIVLNCALVDYTQNVNAARAVKELSEYLAVHPDDELAADMLGAAGRKASERAPRFSTTTLCKDAERILAASIAKLESARPGFRKWGNRWLTGQELQQLEVRRRSAEQSYDSAMRRVASAERSLEEARNSFASANVISSDGGTRRTGGYGNYDGIAAKEQERRNAVTGAQQQVVQAEAAYREAQANAETIKARIPRPDWPVVFQALPPNRTATTQPIIPVTSPAATVSAVQNNARSLEAAGGKP